MSQIIHVVIGLSLINDLYCVNHHLFGVLLFIWNPVNTGFLCIKSCLNLYEFLLMFAFIHFALYTYAYWWWHHNFVNIIERSLLENNLNNLTTRIYVHNMGCGCLNMFPLVLLLCKMAYNLDILFICQNI